jgi:succinate dehydrogenase / fumarate reductase cytochrome b subunit
MVSAADKRLPKEFLLRRLHSIFGLLIVLFLIEHFLTNSQSALLFGESGEGFIKAVNFIKNLPYLPLIEVLLIGVPIMVHGALGIRYALTGKMNSFPSKGDKSALTSYGRNHAYSWQRITAWILLVGIIAHVSYMRFYRYPTHAMLKDHTWYFTRISVDEGLYSVADRLGVQLYNQKDIDEQVRSFNQRKTEGEQLQKLAEGILSQKQKDTIFDPEQQRVLLRWQQYDQQKLYILALTKKPIHQTEVIAQAPDFGTATLLMVRDSFKSVFKAILYTIFVLAASFHAFNGLWTFCITWGVVIQARTQSRLVNVCIGIMVLVAFLGLASVWGTYWINLSN